MGDTYPLVPNRILGGDPEFKTTVIDFGKGHDQRCEEWPESKETFRLVHHALKVGDTLDTLVNFFKEKKGRLIKFYFANHIDGVTYEVNFKEDRLRIQYINSRYANVELELVKCL